MTQPERSRGYVCTFYSYKGGAGRSMALANVAVLMARWGHRVLAVDWDLEAPGLGRYFDDLAASKTGRAGSRDGIVEIASAVTEGRVLDWRECVTNFRIPGAEHGLDFIAAGRRDSGYAQRLQQLDWEHLFTGHQFGSHLERMRNDWVRTYDYVLIDSRTGITDIGGICTIYLPDILVALFVANHQSVEGVAEITERARQGRTRLPVNRGALTCIPVPSRDESRTEYEQSAEWRREYERLLADLYTDFLPTDVSPAAALDLLRIPNVPYWSFGERLPVLTESPSDPSGITYYYTILARLLTTELSWHDSTPARSRPEPARPSSFRRLVRDRVAAAPRWFWIVITVVIVSAVVAPLASAPSAHAPSSPAGSVSWTFPTQASVDGSPAISNGIVYIGDDAGNIYALNAATGHAVWTFRTHSQIDTRPLIVDGNLYVGNDASRFYSLNASNGTINWVELFSGGIDSSPSVADGIIYVGDGNNILHALQATSGRTLWEYPTNGTITSSPAVAAGTVYVGSEDGHVYALSARSGKSLWRFPAGGRVVSSTAVAGGVIYVGSADHDIYALNATTRRIIWVRRTGGAVYSSPFVYRNAVYVGSNDGKIYAVNAATGTILWAVQTGAPVLSSPFVHVGVVYIGSNNGEMYAIDATTGHVIWRHQTGGDVQSSPAVARNFVYVGTGNSKVLALKASV